MKKIIATILITATIMNPLTAQARNMAWWYKLGGKKVYAETMKVVSRKKNTYTLVTSTGYKYKFTAHIEDLEKGDMVSCVMDSRGTTKITDDKVLSVKYCAW